MSRAVLIVLGILAGLVGAVLFIGDGSAHAFCSSLFAAVPGCQGVNERYDGGIVLMVVGGLLLVIAALRGGSRRAHQ